jgi:phosphotransferase system  glucose/maltose/N-acetylglucosamine-specific IIC component
MPEFFAPLPLGAVLLMVINDRVLKAWFHNAVTGKLSDLAICFFLPLFCSALLGIAWPRRPRIRLIFGALLAAAVFTAQEIWTGFQTAFLALLRRVGSPLGLQHFGLTTDWSDLWALLMVPLAVGYGWRRLARPRHP